MMVIVHNQLVLVSAVVRVPMTETVMVVRNAAVTDVDVTVSHLSRMSQQLLLWVRQPEPLLVRCSGAVGLDIVLKSTLALVIDDYFNTSFLRQFTGVSVLSPVEEDLGHVWSCAQVMLTATQQKDVALMAVDTAVRHLSQLVSVIYIYTYTGFWLLWTINPTLV